jgi:hypothetical protein
METNTVKKWPWLLGSLICLAVLALGLAEVLTSEDCSRLFLALVGAIAVWTGTKKEEKGNDSK